MQGPIFSERERYRSSPSVCLSSVTFVLLRRWKFSAMFLCHLVSWPSVTFR